MSVIVPVGGRPEHLRRCLASLRAAPQVLDVVLVDLLAGTRSSLAPSAGSEGTEVRVVPCPPHRSGALRLGEARNVGAALAASRRLCFLDVDCVVSPGALERWCGAVDTYRSALVAPPVRYLRAGWLTEVGGEPPGAPAWNRASVPARRPTPSVDRVATRQEYDLFWSLAFCCDTDTFDRVGGFDTTYVGYGAEDTDFARRARHRDVPLVWVADGVAYHQHHEPSRLDARRVGELVANARRFHSRWHEWPMQGWLRELAEHGLVEWDPGAGVLHAVGPSV
jgi:GT2 family glycosyltransferase